MNAKDYEMSLPINSVLKNTYKIIDIISSSKLSFVYVAENALTEERHIVKEFYPVDLALRNLDNMTVINRLPSTKRKFEDLKENFLNEALIMQHIAHKNIVKYLEYFEENGSVYIIMKYYDGILLDQYLKKYHLNDRDCLYNSIFLPLIDALYCLHKKGIIHRDIKPSNIIIDSEGNPHLLDFGSAIFYKTAIKHNIFTTPGFSPLEQYSDKSKQGVYTDIYSLAATFYYSLTDIIPIDISQRLIEDGIENVREYNKKVSSVMSKTIMWSLAVHYKKRCFSLKFIVLAILIDNIVNKIIYYFEGNNSK